jgi:2',3'-cyclic-nucleotide 2'-phosphodiesterase/3'-nucleotidase/5'-nucleotidase
MRARLSRARLLTSVVALGALVGCAADALAIDLKKLWTYESGVFDGSGAEIVAYDAASGQLFVTNAEDKTIDVLDLQTGAKSMSIDVSGYTGSGESAPNSVAAHNGLIAVAVEDDDVKQDPGSVVFFQNNGAFVKEVTAGALPDMVTFTPDGSKVLVANEGEPNDDYDVDPQGSISIIPVSGGVPDDTAITADFSAYIGQETALRNQGVRIFGPGANAAEDFEPEYISVSPDSTKAFVTLQENNAVAILDLTTNQVTDVKPLGYKDHETDPNNGFDASNRDGTINIQNWPTKGMYQPDAVAAYGVDGNVYFVTANEGDARDYDGYSEEERVKDLTLDPALLAAWPDLQENENLGRLNSTTANGDTDGDGDFDEIYSYGARSFSIWDDQGTLVWDSGDEFEQKLAALIPADFNSNNDENDSFDSRSDDKGPEPEALTLGQVGQSMYAFIGLERVGGIMVYNVNDPNNPFFVDYVLDRDFSATDPTLAGDLGPEGFAFIAASENPFRVPLLAVANEVSGTTTLYAAVPEPAALACWSILVAVGLIAAHRKPRRP